jgi:replicative DNA helicase
MIEKPPPAAVEIERLVLGAILREPGRLEELSLTVDEFSLEKHKRIWSRIVDCGNDGIAPDRMAVIDRLKRDGELENVGGLSYLVSLDDGMPAIPNLSSWVKVLREKSALRKAIWAGNALVNRALLEQGTAAEILADHGKQIAKLSRNGVSGQANCREFSAVAEDRYRLVDPEIGVTLEVEPIAARTHRTRGRACCQVRLARRPHNQRLSLHRGFQFLLRSGSLRSG